MKWDENKWLLYTSKCSNKTYLTRIWIQGSARTANEWDSLVCFVSIFLKTKFVLFINSVYKSRANLWLGITHNCLSEKHHEINHQLCVSLHCNSMHRLLNQIGNEQWSIYMQFLTSIFYLSVSCYYLIDNKALVVPENCKSLGNRLTTVGLTSDYSSDLNKVFVDASSDRARKTTDINVQKLCVSRIDDATIRKSCTHIFTRLLN